MDKFIDILDSIAYEKGIKIQDVENALKEALIKTAQKMVSETLVFDAEINRAQKELKLFQKVEVVSDDDPRLQEDALEQSEKKIEDKKEEAGKYDKEEKIINPENYLTLSEALKIDSNLEVGDFMNYDLEFENMGRNAATILNNHFEYKLQRFIEENLFGKYQDKVGKIITGSVTRVDKAQNTFLEIGEVKAMLPMKSRIKEEFFKVGDVVKAVVKTVRIDKTLGLIVEISRTSPKFLEALIALEVPEVKDERIIIETSARIPGKRAKIALSSIDPNIDPIGSVVGVKGVRITSVSKNLNNESIDCVEYSPIPEKFIARALSPAIISSVKIIRNIEEGQKGEVLVTILSEQKSKAIGKAGLNIRLASMLCKYDIKLEEIESSSVTSNELKDIAKTNSDDEPVDTSSLEALFKKD